MIKLIFHIADIHIHYKNYEHIRFAWKQLIQAIIHQKEYSMLVIAGDIFDHKTYLKAEDIQLFNEMMYELETNEIKTIMIPGNHDYNNNLANNENKENGDMINALVKNANYKFVNYFSLSCKFPFENLLFYIHSPIDLQIFEPTEEELKNYKTIAIIHEAIKGSKTLSGHTFNICRFDPIILSKLFHMTMLGDIHLQQSFCNNVAYSGSFVQKNRSESVEHGYCLWSVETNEHIFMPLKQLSSWIKFVVNDNKAIVNLPIIEKTRGIQLYHTNCTEDWIEKYKDFLETNYKCRLDTIFNNSLITTSQNNDQKDKNTTTFNMEELIKEDLKTSSDETKERVLKMHYDLFETKKENIPNTHWKLNFLSFSGLYCYSHEPNHINFDDLAKLSSLLGENMIGKSAIFDILVLVVFNVTPRGDKKHIINTDLTEGWARCVLTVANKDQYIIERSWFKKETRFCVIKNNQDISGTTLPETYKFLEANVTGSYTIFKDTVMALQERRSIVDLKRDECYQLFSSIMNLETLKNVEKKNHSLLNDTKKELTKLMGCTTSELQVHKFNLETISKNWQEKKDKLQGLSVRNDQINQRIQELLKTIRCKFRVEEVASKLRDLEEYKDFNVNEYEMKTQILGNEIAILNKMEQLKNNHHMNIIFNAQEAEDFEEDDEEVVEENFGFLLANYTSENILYEKSLSQCQTIGKEMDNLTQSIENFSTTKDKKPKTLVDLFSFNYYCDDCTSNQKIINENKKSDVQIKDESKLKSLLMLKSQIEEEMIIHKVAIDQYKKKLYIVQNAQKREHIQLCLDIQSKKEQIVSMQEFVTKFKHHNINAKEYYKLLPLLEESKNSDSSLKEYNELQSELTNQMKLSDIATDIERLYREKINLEIKIQNLEINNEQIKILKINQEDRELYDKIINSKTGLPYKIMQSICKQAEIQSNIIFNEIVTFQLQIKYTEQGIKLSTIDPKKMDSNKIPAQQSSGYQKFIIDIVLRHVLCSLLSSGLPKLLFIDEGFGSASEMNFKIICSQMLPILSKYFDKILIVSHFDDIHNYTDCSVNVIKNIKGYSTLHFGSIPNQDWIHNCNALQRREATKKQEQLTEEDVHFKMIDNDYIYCLVCNKQLKKSGRKAHLSSQAHQRKVAS